MLNEISQSEKDKYHMISFICGIEWTKQTNKQNRNRLIDRENKLTAVRGEGVGGLGEKKQTNSDTDNSTVITRGNGDEGR